MTQLRVLSTTEDASKTLDMLRAMHAEIGQAPLNPARALLSIKHVIKTDRAVAIEDNNGSMIAGYGLFKNPWWYSDEIAYWSQWFYISPNHRETVVASWLYHDLADFARTANAQVYVHIFKPPSARKLATIGTELCFAPSGKMIRFEKGERANVLR